ncbi:MAG: DHA2 family efflux MFS transporter permease subunit [Dehalococcoidales bacterium]|nr:DHA2 family efflux MFS transporter permease subunit [Dehalococcoidales bacterium]
MSVTEKTSTIYRRRWWTLVVIAISVLIVILDSTIVNIALPTLQREMNTTQSELQWIINSYILVFGSLMLTTGSLGDRFGRKRMLQAGILIFAAASAIAAFAATGGSLIIWRAVMGIGGAMILPATLAIITNVFPKEERGKAIGVWAGLNGIGIALGPIIGGLIIDKLEWNWIFLINLPIAVIALVLGLFLVPNSRDPNPKKIDIPGTVISAAALAGLSYGLIQGGKDGWTDAWVIASLAGAVVLIGVFILWERFTSHPVIEISFFKDRNFSAGVGSVCMMALAMIGVSFGMTLYMQFVQQFTALETGIRFIPMAVGVLLGSGSSHRATSKFGTRAVIAAGFAGTAIMGALASFWEVSTDFWIIGLVLFGFGFFLGYIAAPATTAVMGSLSEERAGIGSAMNTVSRMISGSIGVAIIGSILGTVYSSSFKEAVSVIQGLPVAFTEAASDSVGVAVTLAGQLPPEAAETVTGIARQSFMDGWQVTSLITCGLSIVGAILISRIMPSRQSQNSE